MSGNICKFYQFGYCKLDNRCFDVHIDEKCDVEQCREESCALRHPKDCKYMKFYGFCKFGELCAFNHSLSRKIIPNFVVNEAMETIVQEKHQLIKKISELEEIIEKKDQEVEALKVEIGKSSAKNPEDDAANGNGESCSESLCDAAFQCNLCDFKSTRKNGLTVHIGRKHKKLPQLDGNTSCDSLEDVEDSAYYSTEKYWKTGFLSSVYQNYIDALKII